MMRNSEFVYTSFLKHDDYFRIISALKSPTKYQHVRRIMQDNSYVAAYLSRLLLGREMSENTESFEFVGTDLVSVKIGNRNHPIDLIKDLGYAPKEIECNVEVGSCLKDIKFEIADKSMGKSKSYSIENLTSLHWEAWKEEEWT